MADHRDSNKIKESVDTWSNRLPIKLTRDSYDEYVLAMKKQCLRSQEVQNQTMSARERYRESQEKSISFESSSDHWDKLEATRIGTISSMVPDEIIYKPSDYSTRSYETALMFIDVSGFTDLCEAYTKTGQGGPSKLTQVLNSYIGAMVQEILSHNGDVLKFSGDAFLSMWKKTPSLTMQDAVHTAIDCGLIIQKNYGTYVTDLQVVLKAIKKMMMMFSSTCPSTATSWQIKLLPGVCTEVTREAKLCLKSGGHTQHNKAVRFHLKVAISAGLSHFSIIGDENMSHYVIVGQPVWDVKMAEYMSTAGDVLTSASTWMYVNEAEYCTQPCGDGRHTKVLGVGVTWKRVEKIDFASVDGGAFRGNKSNSQFGSQQLPVRSSHTKDDIIFGHTHTTNKDSGAGMTYREFSLRPAVISVLQSSWWQSLRRFMVSPVLRAVDNDEPMDFLTEVRHVVVVFLNIITKTVTDDMLISVVHNAYKIVCSITSESGGLVNKVSMFDKDMMFLVVFGLRGLKHEDEAQNALLCAYQLKETLKDPNIISVSIGVTSGRTYCGVVGHVLRREYTVIGSAVNKAARLMMAYPDKVICDKETFVRSKLDLDLFRLKEVKPLKGIAKPGPVYEFSKSGWPGRMMCWRHPILGRNEEMRKYKQLLQSAMTHQHERFTRYRHHQYAIAVIGPAMVGKTRLIDEFLNITPNFMRMEKITLNEHSMEPYRLIRNIMSNLDLSSSHSSFQGTNVENRLRYKLSSMPMTALQIHAVNTIFDFRFPLPDNFVFTGDLLSQSCVTTVIQDICKNNFPSFRVVGVDGAQFMDDESWRILLIMLETKNIFMLLTLTEDDKLTPVANICLSSNMIVKMHISGIDRWYHAALACQLLDVQAIPSNLEKVIESASGGLPGWIQNFVISLVQRGELTVVTVPRSTAIEAEAVLPPSALLQRAEYNVNREDSMDAMPSITHKSYMSIYSMAGLGRQERCSSVYTMSENENIQMAVLADSYNFEDMKVDMTMDVIILKMYDSLTPFEKMVLKCGSVLGDTFSRRMLLHLIQSDSPKKVAQAVAKLFEIRVLECEGGDFTRDTSMVLIHPAPALPEAIPPYCACLGIREPPKCNGLPMYAFCGYMKFRHSLFKTTTYELLTESQKYEMHGRAQLYIERYTRRCFNCGSGCFTQLFGVRCDDGLVKESKALKRVRQQIAALSAETRMTIETAQETPFPESYPITRAEDYRSYEGLDINDMRRLSDSAKVYRKTKRVRSFSSMDLDNCECLPILLSVYNEVLDHSKVVGDCEKVFETYMEYADLSIINLNIPQAIRLLAEVEEFVKTHTSPYVAQQSAPYKSCPSEVCKIKWMSDVRLARILTLRGGCLLAEANGHGEARKLLFQALKLFCDPFPCNKFWVKVRSAQESIHQMLALYIIPRFYVATDQGLVAQFYEHIVRTLNKMYRLFSECKEFDNAELVAKWSLKYVRRSNSIFRLLCVCYANMISVYRNKQNFKRCLKLENLATKICRRKRGQLDITEVYAVCSLYTSIFLFYVEYGKKMESLEFGLSVIPMISNFSDLTTSQTLVLWMLKLLLSDLRIHEMVLIMREFFYMTDHYDTSSETWYYYYSMVILLDTGYCVEPYGTCERFYIKKGDAIIRSKTPEAAWNFFVCMWLITIRMGAWEKSILWEEKVNHILLMKFKKHEFSIMILSRLVEGLLIKLVNEIDNRNVKKILQLQKYVKTMFSFIYDFYNRAPMYLPRYYLLQAYYNYISDKKTKAFRLLNKASDLAKMYGHGTITIWVEHTRNHWKGTLNAKFIDYWAEHIEPDNLLVYQDFDTEKTKIVPYTLPLPKEFGM